MSSEKIIREALENARTDRNRLVECIDEVHNRISSISDSAPVEVVAALPGILEILTRATDSLTKVNSQVIELAKLRARQTKGTNEDEPLGDEEKETLYESMERDGNSAN